MDFEVRGAGDFAALSRRLKQAGRQDLRRELFRGLGRAVKPARDSVVAELPDHLPNAYAAELKGDLSLRVKSRGGRSPGVSVTAKGRKRNRMVGPLDSGRLRHPHYGNRRRWYEQQVRPHFFTGPMRASAPAAREAIREAMEDVAEKICKE